LHGPQAKMELRHNIPEEIKRLEKIKASLGGTGNGGDSNTPVDVSDAMLASLNAGMGLLKRRVFTKSEDAEGKPLGNYHGNKTKLTKKKYSIKSDDADEEKQRKKKKAALNKIIKANPDGDYTEYEKYRLAQGRQIDKKDLQLNGDLFSSIDTRTDANGDVVIAFINEKGTLVGRAQEKQIGNIRAGQKANTGSAEPAKIFQLSEAEFEQVKTEGDRLIGEVISKYFKT
jgi:hypothetical protein